MKPKLILCLALVLSGGLLSRRRIRRRWFKPHDGFIRLGVTVFSFESRVVVKYGCRMTATGVIEEIKHLPRAEQSRVIEFVHELEQERQLNGKELRVLVEKMTESKDPVEVKRLREEIHHGFYGK